MKYILFTDTHFGTRNNSMTWWKSQSDFIYKQFIPYIESLNEPVRIIHLGDVFDSRSSLSTFIMKEVHKLFVDIANIKNVISIIVIAGNHDFYSPTSDEWSGIELVLKNVNKVHLVLREPEKIEEDNLMFFPWYVQEDRNLKHIKPNVGYLFTHSDIVTDFPIFASPIFSGHIHTPYVNGNTRNLGSCYPLSFADSNQDRYFYVWDSKTDNLTSFANEYSIKFYRIYNEDVLTFDTNNPNDYVELYIKNSLARKPEYIEAVKRLYGKYKNIWNIPQPDELANNTDIETADIETIISHILPEECKEKFEYIKEKVKNDI